MPRTLHAGDPVRIRGERWIVVRHHPHGDAAIIDVRGADRTNAGSHARFLLPFEPLDRLVVPNTPRWVRPARWRRIARHALATATPRIDSLRTAGRAAIDLLPYQLEPALAVTGGHGCRLLIADEVGLGKTIQAGVIVSELLERIPEARALVVCPAGLRVQWQQELSARFALDATVLDAAGIAHVAATLEAGANPWSAAPLVISSIDFIKRPEVMRALEGLVWDLLVLDEAHNLATRSDRASAAASLAWRARTLVMLSATPHSGDEASFARLCGIGDANGRFPLLLFRRTRADAGLPVAHRTRWLKVSPSPAEAAMHHALRAYADRAWVDADASRAAGRLAITVLLRRAASSASSLARSVERRLALIDSNPTAALSQLLLPFGATEQPDDEPGGELAAPALADVREERLHLERLLTLARFAANRESKVERLTRLLARTREPVLVFTEYRDTLAHLRDALAARSLRGIDTVELHGGLTRSERAASERAFTAGDARVLLATDAASEGLNLHQRCRLVINLEVPWSPVRLEQRIGRVDRIGQRRCVHAIHLVACGTTEDQATSRLLARAACATEALQGSNPSPLQMADAILGGVELPPMPAPSPGSVRLVRPQLREAANREVERIGIARRLRVPEGDRTTGPVTTVIRHTRRREALWAFEVTLEDCAGAPVWTTIAGFRSGISPAPVGRAELTKILGGEQLDALLSHFAGHLRDVTDEALRTWLALATERERAIASAVRQRHARIAADLLQPGLFDRRSERRAASQTAVLEEALGRCHARLDALAQLAAVTAGPASLRFAVVLA